MKSKTGIEILLIINKAYAEAIDALPAFACAATKGLKSAVGSLSKPVQGGTQEQAKGFARFNGFCEMPTATWPRA